MAERLSSSLHPLTPPLYEEERLSWLRLFRSRRVGPATFFRLIKEHGSAGAALDALPAIAEAAGVQKYEVFSRKAGMAEMKAGRLARAHLVFYGAPEYPTGLYDLPDAPPLLWVKGQVDILSKPMIAMVGARNASSLGTRMARRIADELSEAGFVVVSGLARGIDAAAHLGALERGTVGVVAGGVDVLYPAENAELAKKIEANGARLAEGPIGYQPRARNFPQRNRLISGLSAGVVVVEAAAKSGSLITARNALDQGREVLAVPGHPMDGRASGGNLLIRDGATLVRGAHDVIEALGDTIYHNAPEPILGGDISGAEIFDQPMSDQGAKQAEQGITPSPPTGSGEDLAARILSKLGPSPLHEDQLIRDLSEPASRVSSELLSLELEGRIKRASGGFLSINPQAAD